MDSHKRNNYKYKVERQLDCSPKPTFSQSMYRQYLGVILSQHPKYTQITLLKNSPNTICIRNLIFSNYSRSCSDKELRQRIFNWFKWFRKTTENRELIVVKEDDYSVTYR